MIERLTGKLLTRFLSKYFILPGESENKSEGGGTNSSRSSNSASSNSSSPSLAVWSGFLSFQHLQFRSSIANDLFDKKGLPFELSCGMVDNVEVNVPWAQLRSLLSGSSGGINTVGSEAEIDIVLDGVYILINTRYEFHDDKSRESNKAERKKEMEAAMAYVASGSLPSNSPGAILKSYMKNRLLSETFLNELFDNLTNRVQVHVRNLHVRVEDLESNPSYPCCYGLTLESLHLTSEESEGVSPDNKEDKSKRGDATRLSSFEKVLARKVMQVNQLSIYCNSMDDNHNESQDGTSFQSTTHTYSPEVLPLQTMSDQPILLSRAMHSSIHRLRPRSFGVGNNMLRHTYLLRPVDATSVSVISKPGNQDNGGYKNTKVRFETNITKFHLDIHSSTIGHLVSFHARLKHHKSLIRHRLHRPSVSVLSNPRQWWKYITRVVRKELRETGNVKRGGWSWLRWYDRMELKKHYMSLYERWLDYGVLGDNDGMIDADENGIDHSVDHAETEASSAVTKAALTMKELNEMQAIENADIDNELTVDDVLIFRTLVHSKRQKQTPTATVSSTNVSVDSQYKVTRFLRRIVTSDDIDEEYTRLLIYLENKEKEDAEKLKQEMGEEPKNHYSNGLSELSAVLTMETIINQGSISLFSERRQGCVFDLMINTFQSKLSVLEDFNSIILTASLLDCMGLEHRANEPASVVFLGPSIFRNRQKVIHVMHWGSQLLKQWKKNCISQ